jgi:hypothetical protein
MPQTDRLFSLAKGRSFGKLFFGFSLRMAHF